MQDKWREFDRLNRMNSISKWSCSMKLNSKIAQAIHERFNNGLKTKDAIGISVALHLLAGEK